MKVFNFYVDMREQNGVYGADVKNPPVYRLSTISTWAKNPIHVDYRKEFLRCHLLNFNFVFIRAFLKSKK